MLWKPRMAVLLGPVVPFCARSVTYARRVQQGAGRSSDESGAAMKGPEIRCILLVVNTPASCNIEGRRSPVS